MTDKDIISGIESGSTSIRQHIQPILSGVRDVTFDDVYQEACIILMENVKAGKLDMEGEVNLSGYLYVICKRVALRYAAKKRPFRIVEKPTRQDEIVIKDEGEEQETGSVEVMEMQEEEAMRFLDKVLDSIPPTCKSILKRFYWDKMSMKDIATLTGLKNEDTAKSTKKRCMDKFRSIAKAMLEDDEKAEAAIRRTIERAALRDQLEECRQLDAGTLARAAHTEGKAHLTDKDIIEGIKNNSPAAWRALFSKTHK
ncbi:MAG: sigma-70 family RNA polymerase sigma factor [Bacteroidales bacterium]|nr:sigma-70 family RNA polymerase sigma factor [Bacteroidales bacterium]